MPGLAGLFFWMNYKTENIKNINISKPLKLDCGQTIRDFPLAYETYGKLNDKKDNAILVFHALTGDQFVSEINPITKKTVVKSINYYFRPNDVENLKGNYNKAKKLLRWKPKTNFKKLVQIMVSNDIKNFQK